MVSIAEAKTQISKGLETLKTQTSKVRSVFFKPPTRKETLGVATRFREIQTARQAQGQQVLTQIASARQTLLSQQAEVERIEKENERIRKAQEALGARQLRFQQVVKFARTGKPAPPGAFTKTEQKLVAEIREGRVSQAKFVAQQKELEVMSQELQSKLPIPSEVIVTKLEEGRIKVELRGEVKPTRVIVEPGAVAVGLPPTFTPTPPEMRPRITPTPTEEALKISLPADIRTKTIEEIEDIITPGPTPTKVTPVTLPSLFGVFKELVDFDIPIRKIFRVGTGEVISTGFEAVLGRSPLQEEIIRRTPLFTGIERVIDIAGFVREPETRERIKKAPLREFLIGPTGERFVVVGGGIIPSITLAEVSEGLREVEGRFALPARVAAELIPTTPFEVGLIAGVGAVAKASITGRRLVGGIIGGIGIAQVADPDLALERRIAAGALAVGGFAGFAGPEFVREVKVVGKKLPPTPQRFPPKFEPFLDELALALRRPPKPTITPLSKTFAKGIVAGPRSSPLLEFELVPVRGPPRSGLARLKERQRIQEAISKRLDPFKDIKKDIEVRLDIEGALGITRVVTLKKLKPSQIALARFKEQQRIEKALQEGIVGTRIRIEESFKDAINFEASLAKTGLAKPKVPKQSDIQKLVLRRFKEQQRIDQALKDSFVGREIKAGQELKQLIKLDDKLFEAGIIKTKIVSKPGDIQKLALERAKESQRVRKAVEERLDPQKALREDLKTEIDILEKFGITRVGPSRVTKPSRIALARLKKRKEAVGKLREGIIEFEIIGKKIPKTRREAIKRIKIIEDFSDIALKDPLQKVRTRSRQQLVQIQKAFEEPKIIPRRSLKGIPRAVGGEGLTEAQFRKARRGSFVEVMEELRFPQRQIQRQLKQSRILQMLRDPAQKSLQRQATKSLEFEPSKQVATTAIKESTKFNLLTNLKFREGQGEGGRQVEKLAEADLQIPASPQAPRLDTPEILLPITPVIPRITTILTPRLDTPEIPVTILTPGIPPRLPPKRPILIRRVKPVKDIIDPTKSFNVFGKPAKLKGQKQKPPIKLNTKGLSRKDALNLGASLIDKSLSRTFEVRPARGKPSKPQLGVPRSFFSQNRNKFRNFRIRRGKKILIDENRFIEKGKFLLDTPGERRKITLAKRLSELRGKKRKKPRTKSKTRTNNLNFIR